MVLYSLKTIMYPMMSWLEFFSTTALNSLWLIFFYLLLTHLKSFYLCAVLAKKKKGLFLMIFREEGFYVQVLIVTL